MQTNTSFTMIEHPCMVTRLKEELREALREFRDGPRAYITSAFARETKGVRRVMLLRLGLAFGLLFYAAAFSLMLILSYTSRSGEQAAGNPDILVSWAPLYIPRLDMPPDGKDSGGGGGGGRETHTPASAGELAAASPAPMVGPTPEDPIHPPVLPIIEAIKLDPRIPIIRDESIPTGLPDGVPGPPSAGPGSNGGIGTGLNGGIGPGNGPGFGPGSGGNTGGRTFQIGGPRSSTALQQPAVDTRPVLLNEPRPFYTEDARKNKIQGVVKVRILVNETGGVSEVVVTRGLPDGLSEQAIRAAYQMRFKPAMKNSHSISYWISNVEIEFNLR
ncbi:MAG TPA: energy transducer TonB [Blastocatellia bacterium]|nr:energy transducer TonB [Blastocatellia bacterium]